MAIDVFFCFASTPKGGLLRHDMMMLCRNRWLLEDEKLIRFHTITPQILECNAFEFQSKRRIYADEHAKSDVYVLADDDVLLPSQSPVKGMIELMKRYPQFVILSLYPSNANIMPWTPEGYEPIRNNEVMEHVSVGHVRFHRKDVVKNWPAQTRAGYDTEECEQIRKEGGRVGYALQFKAVHLGEGVSSLQ